MHALCPRRAGDCNRVGLTHRRALVLATRIGDFGRRLSVPYTKGVVGGFFGDACDEGSIVGSAAKSGCNYGMTYVQHCY